MNPVLRYDLHCHSDQSDGILSPEALVSRAKIRQVDVLALTDHDTIRGLPRARAQAEKEGLSLISGVEFSCLWAGRNIHVVALGFNEADPNMGAALNRQARYRAERAELIASKLEKAGFINALELAKKHAGDGVLGRPHFAKAMLEARFVSTFDQAFKRYLGAGKQGDVKQIWPEFGDILPLIAEAGGVAVLAHPLKYKMTRTKLCRMIEDFRESGGRGIEVISGKQRAELTKDMARIAERFQLLASCGSDFHSPGQEWHELGSCSTLPENCHPVWSDWV